MKKRLSTFIAICILTANIAAPLAADWEIDSGPYDDVDIGDLLQPSETDAPTGNIGGLIPTPSTPVPTTEPTEGIPVEDILFRPGDLYVGENEFYDLDNLYTIFPTDATNKNVTFTSSDENVAIISDDGGLCKVNAGTAIITVKTEDGGYTDTLTIHLYSLIKEDEITLNQKGATYTLNFSYHPTLILKSSGGAALTKALQL